jgi:thioredoxin reductase (NADPH)
MLTATPNLNAFPKLDDYQRSIIRERGRCETFPDGACLFRAGDVDFDFFLVTKGKVKILESTSGVERVVAIHEEGQFTGDVDFLTRRPAVVSACADGECEACRVPATAVRDLLNEIPALSELLLQAFTARRELLQANGFVGTRVVGYKECPSTNRINEFLFRNRVPYTWTDAGSEEGARLLKQYAPDHKKTPIIVCANTSVVAENPSLVQLARCMRIRPEMPKEPMDVVIIGAGPAGLASSVYAASEGLRVLVLDSLGPGGQAGTTSSIENFIGFPSGISGTELANRAHLQLLKFGGSIAAPVQVEGLVREGNLLKLTLDGEEPLYTHAVVVASGAKYRRLPVEGAARYEGTSIFYSATSVESRLCRESNVFVVGGGNSAGQAAMFLSQTARSVRLILRNNDLGAKMSNYLVERLKRTPNITIHLNSEITALHGNSLLERLELTNRAEGTTQELPATAIFSFIGASPNTGFLPAEIARDEAGFLLTGEQVVQAGRWELKRAPCFLETSIPGVFAAGDVRKGSTPRVAFASGDGAMAVACIHIYRSFPA